eukprot:CCRYP_009696-RD/>CCRYP_009696-RD protein AED:0.46 eAED:0.46 QI:59/1/0.5/1/0/0/2/43/89
MVVWVSFRWCGRFWGGFRIHFCCCGNADFASSPKVMYLSFYWGVSAHLLTVMHQMMLRRVEEYGCLGVIQVVWTVLGWFSNSFLLLWRP